MKESGRKLRNFTREASDRWQRIPSRAQAKILGAVWCGHCLGAVPMSLVKGEMRGDFLRLEGTCKICGKRIVRAVEPEDH
jgi:hypothetical protein